MPASAELSRCKGGQHVTSRNGDRVTVVVIPAETNEGWQSFVQLCAALVLRHCIHRSMIRPHLPRAAAD